MIARLEGVLLERSPTRVVLDVGGVGYEAFIPLSTFERLPDEGKTVALRIHTHVREEALQLYGFATAAEREAFGLLLHASRVGPKLAQTILSGMDSHGLVAAIRDGDVASLRGVSGVGAKTAERIVVELRDRVEDLAPSALAHAGGPGTAREPEVGVRAELISALQNLQTQRAKAERVADRALAQLGEAAPIEALLRAALQSLGR